MSKLTLAFVAAGLLAVSAMPAAAAAQKSQPDAGVTKSNVATVDLSAQRRRYYRHGGYYRGRYGGYRGSYYRPYYGYGYGPGYGYGYGYRPYYPAPFPFFPFFF